MSVAETTLFQHNPAISWKVAFDFFRHTVGSTHADVLKEVGVSLCGRLIIVVWVLA